MARQRSAVHAPTQLNELVRRALDLLAYQLRSAGIEVGIELDPELPEIDADPDQLTQVLVNLVVNAQQAMMDGEGPRRLAIRTRLEHGERRLLVEVSDSGPGVPEDLRGRIFEPFFTTKAHGVGTGIGLAERIVFLTGDLLGGHAEAFLESSGRPFLEKPATSEQLRRLVRSVIVEP